LTLDRLRALWPRIVDDARTKSPILGALLQVTEVADVDAGAVTIACSTRIRCMRRGSSGSATR